MTTSENIGPQYKLDYQRWRVWEQVQFCAGKADTIEALLRNDLGGPEEKKWCDSAVYFINELVDDLAKLRSHINKLTPPKVDNIRSLKGTIPISTMERWKRSGWGGIR